MINKEQERQRIARRIEELRKSVEWTDELGIKRHGMTQKELAEKSGLRQGHVSRLEDGKYSATLDVISQIADALGMRIDFVDK